MSIETTVKVGARRRRIIRGRKRKKNIGNGQENRRNGLRGNLRDKRRKRKKSKKDNPEEKRRK